MARKIRINRPGAIYHAMARGNARQTVFRDAEDRERFVQSLEAAVNAHGVRLYLFVLMSNHFHFLVETPHGNISAFMRSILSGYTSYFNHRHDSVGHLFQGRFKAKLVRGDEYLLRLTRYIHLNPVAKENMRKLPLAEKVRRLREYRWSTYPGYAGLGPRWDFVDYAPVLAMTAVFGRKDKQSRSQKLAPQDGVRIQNIECRIRDAGCGKKEDEVKVGNKDELAGLLEAAYRSFVESGLAHSDEGFRKVYEASPLAIGAPDFIRQVEAEYAVKARRAARPEDVAFRRREPRLAAEQVLKVVMERFGVSVQQLRQKRQEAFARAAAAWMLRKYSRMSYRNLAAKLGWGSGAAASIQVRRLAALAEEDAETAREIENLERVLEKVGTAPRLAG